MAIFDTLLLTLSSEFLSQSSLRRGEELSQKFNSHIRVLYIIETKTIKKMEGTAETFLTDNQLKHMEKELITGNTLLAENVIFEHIKQVFHHFEKKIVVGEFSTEVQKAAGDWNATCVIMGYEKNCLVKYRLLEELDIPLLVAKNKGENSILGVCSNLAPNMRVPKITIDLAHNFGYKPHILYVVDPEEPVKVDSNGFKKESNLTELTDTATHFLSRYNTISQTTLATGTLEDEINHYAAHINPDIVVIGREMKRRTLFSKEIKRNLMAKLNNSILFLN